MLPPAAMLNRHVDRYQKRALYLIGYDASLIPDTVETKYELSFKPYDLVWYRSPYELNLLKKVGFVIDHFRMVRCFGLGREGSREGEEGSDDHEEDELRGLRRVFDRSWGSSVAVENSDVDIDKYNNAQNIAKNGNKDNTDRKEDKINFKNTELDKLKARRTVVVCFIDHFSLCTNVLRQDMVSAGDTPYTLLLLGGSFKDWLADRNNGPMLTYDDLKYTIHVSGGRRGNAVGAIQKAEKIYILHQDDIVNNGVTTNDILWPFILAAVSGARIQLAKYNAHLQSLVGVGGSNFDSLDWNSMSMQKTMSSGLVRLHGFGVSTARVEVRRMGYDSDGHLQPIKDETNLSSEEHSSSSKERSSSTSSSSARESSSTEPSSTINTDNTTENNTLPFRKKLLSSPIILELNFSHFIVGRDGSCTITHNNTIITSLIRTMSFLVIDIITDNKPKPDNTQVNIQLSLRGNMFGDTIFNLPLKFLVNLRNIESSNSTNQKVNGYFLNAKHHLPDSYRISIKV
jgi:hypothetical protein